MATDITVASFNIQHGKRRGDGVDLEALATESTRIPGDLLGLQEVDVRVARSRFADEAALVARATGREFVFAPAKRRQLTGKYGNALLVQGTIEDSEVIGLPGHPGHEPRVAVVASVSVAGVRVSAATAHLSIDNAEARLQLEAVAAALDARPGPRVLFGDLNLGTVEVSAILAPRGYEVAGGPPTFPAWSPDRRIDHVAVADGSVTSVVVLELGVSDHRALVAEVRV